MARQKTSVEYSDFTRGIITEASPLTFPDNASLDEVNININRDGSRQRRFGMDWQASATDISVTTLATSGEAVGSFTWRSAGNDGDTNLGVVQIGRALKFFDLDSDTPDTVRDTYTFTAGQVPSPKHQKRFQFASAYGKLIVVVDYTNIYAFSWDAVTPQAVLDSTYSLKIRDRFGIDDGYEVDEQKTTATISDAHRYNLYNQGWPLSTLCAALNYSGVNLGANTGDPTLANAVDFTYAQTYDFASFWPSNADIFWAAKVESLNDSAKTENLGAYNPLALKKIKFGTTPAPRGRYIIDLFARGPSRQTESGLSPLIADTTSGGISTVASFAGRLWYGVTETGLTGGDDRSPSLGSMVFYSELSEDVDKWGNCHARNDPTNEDFADPLATDGGFLSIPELGQIYKMVPLGESMFLLSSNGVWEVYGGDAGFNAQDQTVVKVTDVGPVSASSVVTGENVIGYWAESGIYAITIDKASLRGVSQNITEETIQTLYDEIPIEQKRLAVGSYDFLNKQVSWMYNLDSELGSNFYYQRELIFSTIKGGFTRRYYAEIDHTSNNGPYLCGYLNLRSVVPSTDEIPVTAGGVIVTAGGLTVTVGRSSAEQRTKSSTLYLTAHQQSGTDVIRVSGLTNFDFYDWPQVADTAGTTFGADAAAYLITGAITGGDTRADKFLPYVHVRAKRTETDWIETIDQGIVMIGESSILMSAQWDWTNDPSAGRWSRASQVYRLPRLIALDTGHIFAFDVIKTRNKLRGKGKAVSLKFASEPGKDLYLYGWGLEVLVDK